MGDISIKWGVMDAIQQTAGKPYEGGCHCGAIRFVLTGPLRPIVICHCTDCLGLAGYSWAATNVDLSRFSLKQGEAHLDWYQSSDIAKRGFCKTCHSQLFYKRHDRDDISISPGMLDSLDGLYSAGHIYRHSLPSSIAHIDSLDDLDSGF